jgi:glycosyltransferase involved in cell wall biosynthesis
LEGVLKLTNRIIVVNDGSTDDTAHILQQYDGLTVVRHEINKGKGMALRSGFDMALKLGYDYVVSIDSDGQHNPADIPAFLLKLESHGPCLIIGDRNMSQSDVPSRSSFGNRFSNFWFKLETGVEMPDTQSGFRLYPVRLFEGMSFFTRKFEFEIEVIVRAAWKSIPILSVPVSVKYFTGVDRVSHFRPFTDFARISVLNTVLVTFTLFYYLPKRVLISMFSGSGFAGIKNELLQPASNPIHSSASVAFGVFMGIIPIWGFQMATALILAYFMRLNKSLVIISANISLPPMIPVIIYLSYAVGGLWLGDDSAHIAFNRDIDIQDIYINLRQYVIGSILLASTSALVLGLTFWMILVRKSKNSKA